MTVKGNSAVAFGLWDSVDSQGRIIAPQVLVLAVHGM